LIGLEEGERKLALERMVGERTVSMVRREIKNNTTIYEQQRKQCDSIY
jgi:hypothetical protein